MDSIRPIRTRRKTKQTREIAGRQRAILECIEAGIAARGYPPSVREIAEAVGLASPSTVHNHLTSLERMGYLRRDPTKPRAIELLRPTTPTPSYTSVPLIGQVAAGSDVLAVEQFEDIVAVPSQLARPGSLFLLRVKGDSMVNAGILPGDLVLVRKQPDAEVGQIIVAGIPGDEATVKRLASLDDKVVLEPANPAYEPIVLSPDEVKIYGPVVALMRRMA